MNQEANVSLSYNYYISSDDQKYNYFDLVEDF